MLKRTILKRKKQLHNNKIYIIIVEISVLIIIIMLIIITLCVIITIFINVTATRQKLSMMKCHPWIVSHEM